MFGLDYLSCWCLLFSHIFFRGWLLPTEVDVFDCNKNPTIHQNVFLHQRWLSEYNTKSRTSDQVGSERLPPCLSVSASELLTHHQTECLWSVYYQSECIPHTLHTVCSHGLQPICTLVQSNSVSVDGAQVTSGWEADRLHRTCTCRMGNTK